MFVENALSVGIEIQHYAIVDVLGSGSFGVTYRAVDQNTGTQVAIKEYLPKDIAGRHGSARVELMSGELSGFFQWGMDRFVTEAQILAQFNHPNIVKVFGYFHANGTAYFVMEYQRGQSLDADVKRRRGPPGEKQLRGWLIPVLHGLAAIHGKNYLHRDIKPGNIFLSEDGRPVLIDFGAACYALGDEVRKTSDILTPAYASIEQYGVEQPLGPWSDLYALGATMYRCVAGKPPMAATKRANAIFADEPDPLPSILELGRRHYSSDLLDAIAWMLKLRSVDRPQSAQEVLRRLGETPSSAMPVAASAGAGGLAEGAVRGYRQSVSRNHYKILVVGTRKCGKSTAVATLGDISPLTMERPGPRGEPGTFGFDYGWADIGTEERLHIYGAPGGSGLEPFIDLLAVDAALVLLLIDNRRDDRYLDVQRYLKQFGPALAESRLAIGVTHMDEQPHPGIEAYQSFVLAVEDRLGYCPPIMSVDPHSRRDLQMLLQAAFHAIDPGVRKGVLA